MSHETPQRPKVTQDSDGNGAKWLLGAAAAAVLIGGGYFAYKNFSGGPASPQSAYNDASYQDQDSLRAGAYDDTQEPTADLASSDERPAQAASTPTRRSEPARTTRRAPAAEDTEVAEATIGITPISASTSEAMPQDENEIVVMGPRRPVWSRAPSAQRLSAMYPRTALDRGREGEASLHCMVQNSGALDCERVSEYPAQAGFGAAAMRVSRTLRHAPQRADGTAAAGSPVNLRVVFRMTDADRRRG